MGSGCRATCRLLSDFWVDINGLTVVGAMVSGF